MKEQYDMTKCINNIDILCKSRGIPIYQLEAAVGISKGYLSRIRNHEARMQLDTLINISNYLKVSIDDLIFANGVNLTEKKDMMKSFTSFLKRQTLENKIEWIPEDPNLLCMYATAGSDYPLIRRTSAQAMDEDGNKVYEPNAEYFSYIYGTEGHTKAIGKLYHYQMPGTEYVVYVSHISHQYDPTSINQYGDDIRNDDVQSFEFYIFSDSNCTACINSAFVETEVAHCIEDLYKAIASTCDNIMIEQSTWIACYNMMMNEENDTKQDTKQGSE